MFIESCYNWSASLPQGGTNSGQPGAKRATWSRRRIEKAEGGMGGRAGKVTEKNRKKPCIENDSSILVELCIFQSELPYHPSDLGT